LDLPPVSYVLRTSPGRVHLFWKAAGFTVEHVEALQRLLARELGTDRAATSAAQMTRLPGFLNHKRQPPYGVAADYYAVDAVRTAGAFPSPMFDKLRPSVAADVIERTGDVGVRHAVRRFIAATPPAIAGERGDLRTYLLCRNLVRRFQLGEEDALELLAEWNSRCAPPWRQRDLRRKLQRARQDAARPSK
jgi:hypothetical protein